MSDFHKIEKKHIEDKLPELVKNNVKVILIKKFSSVEECKKIIDFCYTNSMPYKHRFLDKKKDFWSSIDVYPYQARTRRIFKTFEMGKRYRKKFKSFDEVVNLQYGYLYNNIEQKKTYSKFSAYQYPKGGGFFSKHKHTRWPTNYGVILNLSKTGKDFKKGGVNNFYYRKKKININRNEVDQGDLTLFRYDLHHEIPPVDPHEDLKFDKSGRWTVTFPILYNNPFVYKKQRPR
jgi:hypothetical protein|tara:strand:+ start:810 stop:1508 length:699 start_codon:yes stop_codon:yes gene_type:complete